jgi:hypothetical protein
MTATATPAAENVDNVLDVRAPDGSQCSPPNQGHTIVCCNPTTRNCRLGSDCNSAQQTLFCC